MSFLRLANVQETSRVYYEDTEEYLELRAELTKREASELLRFAPRETDDLDGGMRFIARAFTDIVVGWSLVDNEGNPIPAEVEYYDLLDAAPASWVDRTIGERIRKLLGAEAEDAEKKLAA